MRQKKGINPFYMLLLLAGCAFAITACAYGVMTVRQLHRSRAAELPTVDPFSETLDQLGPTVMVVELLLLAVGTIGAIALDQYKTTKPSQPNSSRDAVDSASAERDAAPTHQNQERRG